MPPVYLSIIIPAYNEAQRIAATLAKVTAFLAQQPYTWEVVVADDGSTDATASLVRAFAQKEPRVRLLSLSHRGKGWAVRHGMLAATGQYRFLCDADLSMPIELLPRFLPPQRDGYAVAIGSREAPGARRMNEPWRRHLVGRVFNLMVRLVAVSGLQDTQCGFKCFTAEAAQRLFSQQRLTGFGFDVEVLFLARRQGIPVVEVPIDWYFQGNSKVRLLRDTVPTLRDLLIVRWNALRGRYQR
ncbi:MAG: glycosyltransferase family 2 protein [Chloroflexi bacterium]|nr:glycosyltransferase family 2 protein [Chloroflexota bacterium]